jgi:anti-anti-sigma regulatory factor
MLRISRDEATDGCVNVLLEGELTGPWVEETKRVCEAATAQGHKIRLDLSGVTFVDRPGLKLLAALQKINAILENCSAFLNAQLHFVESNCR